MTQTQQRILFADRELHQVAYVQAGYFHRTRVESSAGGTHRLLQARDVSADTGINLRSAELFSPARKPDLYRVSKGDLLILARGQDRRPHLVQDDLENTLASSVFHIIRPNCDSVVPGYLAWWLNQPDVQAEINAGSRGTGIGYVSRQHMERIPVRLPPREMQQRIADTMALLAPQGHAPVSTGPETSTHDPDALPSGHRAG